MNKDRFFFYADSTNSSNIIIIGAGIGGLYLALRLIKQGVPPSSITMVDPRAGDYTRPGHLNETVFTLVAHKTGIDTHHSSANHIKDLERSMYHTLQQKNVRFVKEKFIDLVPATPSSRRGLVTQTTGDKPETHRYPGDFVFDCSGRAAVVTQAVNNKQKAAGSPPHFVVSSPQVSNPIPSHLVAQVNIPDIASIRNFLNINTQAKVTHFNRQTPAAKIIQAREQLQALGWTYEAFPTFYTFEQAGSDKVCLYMETPENLPSTQYHAWIKLLLTLYSNNRVTNFEELSPSKKYHHKPRIMGFRNGAYHLNRIVFKSNNLPNVFTCFDAQKSFDYRKAHGASSGMTCCDYMLSHMKIVNGKILSFDTAAIETQTLQFINDTHMPTITDIFKSRQDAINQGYEYFSDLYLEATNQLPVDESEQKATYLQTAATLAYRAAVVKFKQLSTRPRGGIASLAALNDCLSLLLRASTSQASATQDHHAINRMSLEVLSSLNTEISRFDINSYRLQSSPQSCDKAIKTLEKIKNNFQQFEGHFATTSCVKNLSQWIEQLQASQHQISFSFDLKSQLEPKNKIFTFYNQFYDSKSIISSFDTSRRSFKPIFPPSGSCDHENPAINSLSP